MNCRRAQAALSASMDGERMSSAARSHVDGCPACRNFSEAAQRIRVAARVRVAEPVPDLTGSIMARVRGESEHLEGVMPLRPRPLRPRANWRVVVAAAVVGALVGAAAVSRGLLPSRDGVGALAETIPHEIAAAAQNLSSYQASYRVTEYGWRPEVPVRTFGVSVAFASPERYRVVVDDATDYPAGDWRPNDSRLTVDGGRWSLAGPDTCVPAATTPCPPSGSEARSSRTIEGRPPFDADSPMPTDIVLPVTSLAGSSRVDVLGEDTIGGRPAVEVGLSAQDAAPLFAFFQQAGSWRPLYPSDRVSVWLDSDSWFPLAYTVTSSGGEDRAAWAARNGLGREPAGRKLLDVALTSLSLAQPDPPGFTVTGSGHDEGFRDVPADSLEEAVGYAPVQPTRLEGLKPYRSGYLVDAGSEAILSYSAGLTWLRMRESRSWRGDSLFGNLDAFAERVVLPGGGIAYYEPASDQWGRRMSIHASDLDVFLESNLPRARLLAVAASIPIRGEDIPAAWRVQHPAPGVTVERLSIGELEARAGFAVLVPGWIPPGHRLVATQLTTFRGTAGAALFYARSGVEPGGFGVRVYQSPGETIPPASGTFQAQVMVRGTTGRWSPAEHQLEWSENGVYRSITAPGLELRQVLFIAASLEPPS